LLLKKKRAQEGVDNKSRIFYFKGKDAIYSKAREQSKNKILNKKDFSKLKDQVL